jgi:alkylation response protein AidB-like acyl-CoA dehydrogenase
MREHNAEFGGRERAGGALDRLSELQGEFSAAYKVHDTTRTFPLQEVWRLRELGFLGFTVPEEAGGWGGSVSDVSACLVALASAYPSLAQIMFVHWNSVLAAPEFMEERQRTWFYREVIERSAFLGNAASERNSRNLFAWETRFVAQRDGSYLLNGRKFFATGSKAADYFWVMGALEDSVGMAIVPSGVSGVHLSDDWDSMGQRGTGSGSVEFKDVRVTPDMLLRRIELGQPDPTSVMGLVLQSGFTSMYVGIARGALKEASEYVKTKARPWFESGVQSASEDPYILQAIGKMHAYLATAEAMLAKAVAQVDEVIALRGVRPREEIAERRAEAGVSVAAAKLVSTEVGLAICQDVFQVCGARSTLSAENMDRFWRDMRTLTLHDPKDYKAKLIGEYLLLGRRPSGAGGIS